MAASPLPLIEKNTKDTADNVAVGNDKLASVNEAINRQTGVLSDYIEHLKSDTARSRLLENNASNRGPASGPRNVGALQGASEAVGGVLAGLGGLLGGVLGGAGSAVLGAGVGILGAALPVLAAGLATLANPVTLIGGGALVAFFLGLSGVTWIFGEGLKSIGSGFSAISKGIEDLGRVGETTDTESLIAAGKGLTAFLGEVGSVGNFFGAVVTFLTGDLSKIADGLNSLNSINVNDENLKNAGASLNAFFKELSAGSLWDSIKGSITTSITPDLTGLANSLSALSAVTFDLQKFKDLGQGMREIAGPLADFAGSGILGNFVGKNSLTDLADGLTALNATQVDRLGIVSAGFGAVNSELWEFTKTGLVANFVGKNAILDLADGITYLNNAQVDRLGIVNDGLNIIKGSLLDYTGTGFLANFVGKNAITDLTDAATDMNERLGTEEQLLKAKKASESLIAIKEGLLSFTKASFVSSLAGVGAAIFDFFSGDQSPIKQVMGIVENVDALTQGANALGLIAENLNKFGAINFDGSNFDIKGFAEDLKEAVPIIEGAIMGDDGGWFGKKIFGLASPEIDYKKAAESIDVLRTALKVDAVAGQASAGGAAASNIVNNYVTNNYVTNSTSGGGAGPVIMGVPAEIGGGRPDRSDRR